MNRRRAMLIAVISAATLALVAALRFGAAVLFASTLAMPALEPWARPWSETVVSEEIISVGGGRALRADVYRPAHARAAVLLVHGLSRFGRRHPELVRLARLLGRHGQLVMVPQFEGLAAFRLAGSEADDIRAALRHLHSMNGRVALAGFSFGAGPTLLAAAGDSDLRWVGSFGGYADLRNVILYLTTGVHSFRGERYVQRVEEYNRAKLLTLLVPFIESERDRQLLDRLAGRKLANPSDDTGALERELGDEGRTVSRLIASREETEVVRLLAVLPASARAALERLSPLAVVPRLSTRLLLVHGEADDSIPFTESLRMAAAAGERARVVVLHSFHHTGPVGIWPSVAKSAVDASELIGLMAEVLR